MSNGGRCEKLESSGILETAHFHVGDEYIEYRIRIRPSTKIEDMKVAVSSIPNGSQLWDLGSDGGGVSLVYRKIYPSKKKTR